MDNGNKKKIGTLVAILFILTVIVVGALVLVNRRDKKQVEGINEIRVAITDEGFSPSTISVSKGTKVVWVNNTAAPHKVGANPFPDATSLPDLNSEAIAPDQSYSYTFENAGSFDYADYTNPTVGGTVQVK